MMKSLNDEVVNSLGCEALDRGISKAWLDCLNRQVMKDISQIMKGCRGTYHWNDSAPYLVRRGTTKLKDKVMNWKKPMRQVLFDT